MQRITPEFNSAKALWRRLKREEPDEIVSIENTHVPEWQREVVWTDDEMGLLAFSMIKKYPIGMLILWEKPNGISVPIDGRQRLTAIKSFFENKCAIPDSPTIDPEFRGKKYDQLSLREKEAMEDYQLSIVLYRGLNEEIAKDIFIKLQGGKSLTKAEIRSAYPGLVTEFVTELTSAPSNLSGDEDENDQVSGHPFFDEVNISKRNKGDRALCDMLVHEHLYPGVNKHWTSLESLYIDKKESLSTRERDEFRTKLQKFYLNVQRDIDGERRVNPRLKTFNLIITYFQVWNRISTEYDIRHFNFSDVITEFENLRSHNEEDIQFIKFNEALSSAGYSEERMEKRMNILLNHILTNYPLFPLDNRRNFTEQQKLAIWEKAEQRCEWVEDGSRCTATFANFREADADHIVRWSEGGPTTVENGRLLCIHHNRSNTR
jgi:hypothetical protein